MPGHVHLGFAAQTEQGLVVPVVRDAHRLIHPGAVRGARRPDRGGPRRHSSPRPT